MNHFPHKKDDRVVLVTGGTTGIGLTLVKKLHQMNFRVVATARNSSLPRFEQHGLTENERFLIRPLDVTKLVEHSKIINEICRTWGSIDVLVNNAGIAYRAVMEEMYPAGERIQFATNYFGPMHLIRLVLPFMREQRRGHIINVSSVGGMMAMPTMGAYSASKFALEGASEALWYELRPWGIHISLIQPGFVHSNSFQNVRLTEKTRRTLKNDGSPYYAYYANMLPFIERMMNFSPTTPEKIAARIIRTMKQRNPRLRIPATPDAWLFYWLRRLLPRRLYHYVLYRGLPKIDTWVK
jgi:short-subunit dehydrogenase